MTQNQKSSYLLKISLVSTLGGVLFGYDTAVIAGCNTFLQSHFGLTDAMLGWVVASALIGTILGCILSGTIADKFGRKKSLFLASLLFVIAGLGSMLPPQFLGDLSNPHWVVSNSNTSLWILILSRIVGGIGVGITSVVAPIYISEFTPPDRRGKLVSLYQLSITVGILIAFVVDWIVLNNAGVRAGLIPEVNSSFWTWIFVNELWRGMFGIQVVIALIFLILLFFVPESPRWLIVHGQLESAIKIMNNVDSPAQVQNNIREITTMSQSEQPGFKALFQPFLRVPLLIGILLPMFSHLSGIGPIMYFAPNIINGAFQNVENSFLGAVFIGTINTVSTFIAISFVDRFGRKKLLMIGVVGCMISLAGTGLLFALGTKWVIVPLLCYVACFAFSYGPLVWVIISEIFPTKIRGLAVSMGSLSLMTTAFILTFTNPILIGKIGTSWTFFIYSGLMFPAIWFISKFVIETKGKTLEEIQNYWKARK